MPEHAGGELTADAPGVRGLGVAGSLRFHWPEYLMEGGESGLYLFAACTFATLLWHPASPVQQHLPNDAVRRLLMGLAMGATIIAIVHSAWGKQSGAYFNPAVTFAFYRLRKVALWDAVFYCATQLCGAVAGVALAALLLRGALAHRAVRYAATLPGVYGESIAFAAEMTMSFLLMTAILCTSNHRIFSRYTRYFAAILSIEESVYLPRILEGFTTIDGFIGLAQTILQSRKSRSGNSLESHVREIFIEEGLRSMKDFQHRPVTEDDKRPDFLFPSQVAYEDPEFPALRLRMLAAKTTCKDRWRQVTHEADRIQTKHLLTLQEGVSEGQFNEMIAAGVQLVVPRGLHDSFPKAVRPHLITLESFLADVRFLSV